MTVNATSVACFLEILIWGFLKSVQVLYLDFFILLGELVKKIYEIYHHNHHSPYTNPSRQRSHKRSATKRNESKTVRPIDRGIDIPAEKSKVICKPPSDNKW